MAWGQNRGPEESYQSHCLGCVLGCQTVAPKFDEALGELILNCCWCVWGVLVLFLTSWGGKRQYLESSQARVHDSFKPA